MRRGGQCGFLSEAASSSVPRSRGQRFSGDSVIRLSGPPDDPGCPRAAEESLRAQALAPVAGRLTRHPPFGPHRAENTVGSGQHQFHSGKKRAAAGTDGGELHPPRRLAPSGCAGITRIFGTPHESLRPVWPINRWLPPSRTLLLAFVPCCRQPRPRGACRGLRLSGHVGGCSGQGAQRNRTEAHTEPHEGRQ
jgi:hypothetical protein